MAPCSRRGAAGAAAATALVLALLAAPCSARRLNQQLSGGIGGDTRPQGGNSTAPPVRRYEWRVTVGVAAPDCFERQVILVNGQVSPTLEVEQGDMLELTVVNAMPPNWPNTHRGITIHWHGWDMRGYPWEDGTAYVELCPIQSGTSFTYRFQVNEPPGTYLWHGHAGNDRVDGLAGPLIVRPRAGSPEAAAQPQYDEERTLFLADWWHATGASLAMRLNRPFDANRTTPGSGAWAWVNNPQALLFNGNGFYGDCALNAGGVTSPNVTCNVSQYWVPPGASAVQPWASAVNPGCRHENVTVEAGKTYLIRLISGTSLLYQTVCFEGHDVTIVAADAVPVDPVQASALNGCVDINSGQRYDLLLTANQAAGNYWVSSMGQFRPGSPAGYAVLHYEGSEQKLPATKPPQPGSVAPWTLAQAARIVAAQGVAPPPEPTLQLLLNITQPLMRQTGQLRWALNNVAGQITPACDALLDLVYDDPRWIDTHLAQPARYNNPAFNATALGVEQGNGGKVEVFLTAAPGAADPTPPPVYPTAGTHLGEVVQVVLQNLPANANNGDYRIPGPGATRNATEQHPFHLHGHHFWVLGTGLGPYNPAAAALNTANPPFRDTATLPQNGWTVLRFRADNPGLWIFHCHLLWHEYMGQLLVLAEALDELPERPNSLPTCPKTCAYNAAPWSKPYVKQQYGDAGFELP